MVTFLVTSSDNGGFHEHIWSYRAFPVRSYHGCRRRHLRQGDRDDRSPGYEGHQWRQLLLGNLVTDDVTFMVAMVCCLGVRQVGSYKNI